MESTTNEQKISAPFLQIKYVKCTEKIPGLLVSIAGLLTSIWANCLFVISCFSFYSLGTAEMRILEFVIFSFQLTHLIVILTSTAGLIFGLKENNKSLLTPWLGIKILEVLMLFIGIILMCSGYIYGTIIAILMGIIFLLIGSYISLCIWDTYKKMDSKEEENHSSLEDINIDEDTHSNPPSYDSYLKQ